MSDELSGSENAEGKFPDSVSSIRSTEAIGVGEGAVSL